MEGICNSMGFMTMEDEGCGLKICRDCHSCKPGTTEKEFKTWLEIQPPYDRKKEGVWEGR